MGVYAKYSLSPLNKLTFSSVCLKNSLQLLPWLHLALSRAAWVVFYWPGFYVYGVCLFWNHWPSANLAMVCVRAWTLLGRFHGSCLTWSRSFLVQLSLGSMSWWNSVQKQSQVHCSQMCMIHWQTTTEDYTFTQHTRLCGVGSAESSALKIYVTVYSSNDLKVVGPGRKRCQRLLPCWW